MELATQEKRMAGYFDDLHVSSIGSRTGDAQTGGGQRAFILTIEFITVAMTFTDFILSVRVMRQRPAFQPACPGTQAHRPPQLFDPPQIAQLVNHAMRSSRIELAGVSLLQATHIASEFNTRRLHSQADPEVRHLVFAGVLNSFQHAFYAALPE